MTEEARVGVMAAEFLHYVPHGTQQVGERHSAGRSGLVEAAPQIGGGGWTHHGARGQRVVVFRYEIEGGAAHFTDLSVGEYQLVRQSDRVTGNLHTRFEAV